ncbi:hypothetical protein CPC08DRAFT_771480 [Agrocybe pediades]|nr:hypothetical protein CPC08DRAFT_771480 [Agrocybe pediades]
MQFLPGRFDPASPRFDGQASHLAIFLDEVEALAASHAQTPQQTIRAAIRYSPDDAYELWSGIPEAKGEDWQVYKAALYRLYPGSDGTRRYSIRQLVNSRGLATRTGLATGKRGYG